MSQAAPAPARPRWPMHCLAEMAESREIASLILEDTLELQCSSDPITSSLRAKPGVVHH